MLPPNEYPRSTNQSQAIKRENMETALTNSSHALPTDHQNCSKNTSDIKMKSEINLPRENGLSNTDDQTSSSKKRKISENEDGHVNDEKSFKVGKFDLKNGLKQDPPLQDTDIPTNNYKVLDESQRTSMKCKKPPWIISCDRCTFETDNMDEFIGHVNSLHSNLNDFKCHECSFATTSVAILNKHCRYEKHHP